MGRVQVFCWLLEDSRISEKPVTVLVFGDTVEGAMVRAVRSVGTLRACMSGCKLSLEELAAIVEDHVCTKPPASRWPAENFVLYHAGGVGVLNAGRLDPDEVGVRQGQEKGGGDSRGDGPVVKLVACECGRRYRKSELPSVIHCRCGREIDGGGA